MFLTELAQALERRLLVVYPGRFQPFHLGHLAVLKQLQAKYGADNVRVATSPNTVQDKLASGQKLDKKSLTKNPFTATEKVQLMHAAGVNDHQILLVNEPYNIEPVIEASHMDPRSTVLIFAVGAPDKERLEVDGVYQQFTPTGRPTKIPPGKAVGDDKPYKTLPKNLADTVTVAQGHAYVIVVPEKHIPFEIKGKTLDISHGTECRAVWNQVRNDPKASDKFLQTLYGRATPELKHIFNKITPDSGAAPVPGTPPAKTPTKLPRPQEPEGGMKVKKAAKKANTLVKEAVLPTDTPPGTAPQTATAPQAQATNTPQAKQAAQALQKGLEKYQQLYPNTDHGFITRFIDHIEPDGTVVVAGDNSPQKIKALLAQGGGAQFQVVNQEQLQIAQQRPQVRTMRETAGVGVVKGGNDPRYSMATAGDQNAVDGNTLGREMKAFGLTGRKSPGANRQQKNVNHNIGKGINESEEIRQQMAKFQHQLIDMANDEIDRIKERMANEHDPAMLQHYKQRLQKQRDKILKIMMPGM
jgi:cytidyltransferase-like protein